MDNKDLKICPNPWTFCEILEDNNVYFCCPAFCNWHEIGNLKTQSFDEIWNGEKAKFFRNEMLSGDYLLCNLKTCTYKARVSVNEISKYYDENGNVKYPETIKLSNSSACNVVCITCRNELIKEKDEETIKENKLSNAIKDLKYLYVSGSGDPFVSSYYKNFIKEVSEKNKICKFGIYTNGILMTKEMCNKLGILNRITVASISIHAATEDTYNKIVKYGNFKKVMQNVAWISEDNTIPCKILNFVINNINYKEIPDFINLANSYNFIVIFTHYRYWGTEFGKNYEEIAVWLPDHPEHKEFLNILNTDIVKQHKHYFDGMISQFIYD